MAKFFKKDFSAGVFGKTSEAGAHFFALDRKERAPFSDFKSAFFFHSLGHSVGVFSNKKKRSVGVLFLSNCADFFRPSFKPFFFKKAKGVFFSVKQFLQKLLFFMLASMVWLLFVVCWLLFGRSVFFVVDRFFSKKGLKRGKNGLQNCAVSVFFCRKATRCRRGWWF